MVTRGFTGSGGGGDTAVRFPNGQYLVEILPVLPAGPTASAEVADCKPRVRNGLKPSKVWNWGEFNALPTDGALVAGLMPSVIETERYGR